MTQMSFRLDESYVEKQHAVLDLIMLCDRPYTCGNIERSFVRSPNDLSKSRA